MVVMRCIAKFYVQKVDSIQKSQLITVNVNPLVSLMHYIGTWYCDRVSKPKQSQIIYE